MKSQKDAIFAGDSERLDTYKQRAEFAESLLCALAFDAAIVYGCGYPEHCQFGVCVFCDASRHKEGT